MPETETLPSPRQQSRLLIVGDSNCLPRRDGKYRDSWICLLKQALPRHDCIVLADGSRTSEYLALNPRRRPDGTTDYDPSSLEMYDASIVIIHLGIVDCAPRLFSRFESRFISTLPARMRNVIIAVAKRIRRRTMRRAYVSLEAFEANVRQYLVRCRNSGVETVVIIGIPIPDLRAVRRNPAIVEAVARYNAVFKRLAGAGEGAAFIDPLRPEQDTSALYVEDGYHLSVSGHQVVFQAVARALGLTKERLRPDSSPHS